MNRIWTACLLLVACLFGPWADAAERNVLFIVTDDLSPDMGCYGNPVIQTPHMDALAEAGVRFDFAFATTASCSASRSVILTGLHNHANGQYGHQHHFHKFSSYANIVSLPVYMSKAGYRTAVCGKFHVAPTSVYKFDTVIPGPTRNPVVMANNCEEFIREESDQPFFLYFCTSDPHRGGGIATELPYQPNRFGNPPPDSPGYPGIEEVTYDPDDVIVPGYLPDTPTCRAELAQYYQSVSRIDQGLQRLLEIIKDAGKWDNTLIIFTSDHGIAMPGAKTTVYEGGMLVPLLVRNPYNEQAQGVVNQAMISFVDFTPTILDFAGILDQETGRAKAEIVEQVEQPERGAQVTRDVERGQFHGRSFLPILHESEPEGWDEVNASHTFHEIQMYYPMRVVRERRYKLIWNIAHGLPFPFASDLWAAPTWQAQYEQGPDAPFGAKTVDSYMHRPEFELYDLKNDPCEGTNLADDPQYADQLQRLTEKLKQFQQDTHDPWILKWEYE